MKLLLRVDALLTALSADVYLNLQQLPGELELRLLVRIGIWRLHL